MRTSLEASKAQALVLARRVTATDNQAKEVRAETENAKRLVRLELGGVIADSPDPDAVMSYLVQEAAMTMKPLYEMWAVVKFNRLSGEKDYLTSVQMSFTQNRNLAYIHTALERQVPVKERIRAVQRSIDRNGFFKEDRTYRRDIGILPPPNSLENIIERAERDPLFRREMQDKGMFVLDGREGVRHTKGHESPWVARVATFDAHVARLSDYAFEAAEVPHLLYQSIPAWIASLTALRSLYEGQREMREVQS